MRKTLTGSVIPIFAAAITLGFSAVSSHAATITLFEKLVNIDGVLVPPNAAPGTATIDESLFNVSTGLGSITIDNITGVGPHFVGLFLDHEIDEASNTFFNENGVPVNTAAASQSWEIDEPGFLFGDIYSNFSGSSTTGSLLDNTTGVPPGSEDDVSMALGWSLNLASYQTASITFLASETAPASGFYLTHTDPLSGASIYFSSSALVLGNPPAVPDGGASFGLVLFGLAALAGMKSRQNR